MIGKLLQNINAKPIFINQLLMMEILIKLYSYLNYSLIESL